MQARGQGKGWAPLLPRGREFMVRTSAQIMDDTGRTRDQVAADPDGTRLADLTVPALAFVAGTAGDEPTRVAVCEVLMDRLSLSPALLGGACDGVDPLDDCR